MSTDTTKSSKLTVAIVASILGLLSGSITVYSFMEGRITKAARVQTDIEVLRSDLEEIKVSVWNTQGDVKTQFERWLEVNERLHKLDKDILQMAQ